MEALQSIDLSTPKALQILQGAKSVFLELGYEGASVEEIARRAQVSKGTIYNYFPDKQTLFAAVVNGECQNQAQCIFQIERNGEDVETLLRRIALHFIEFLLSPFSQNMFRIVVAEAQRFPELGQAFYASGPALGKKRLVEFLAQAVKNGELAIDDLELAANQFLALCKTDLFYQKLLGLKSDPTQNEVQKIADSVVATFLKAFGR